MTDLQTDDMLSTEPIGHDGQPSSTTWMEQLVIHGKSTGPREVLLRLAINRHVLQLQMAAVQIQTSYRRFAAHVRVQRIRQRLKAFYRLTAGISAAFLEEAILGIALEMAMGIVQMRDELKVARTNLQKALDLVVEELAEEMADELIREVVKDTITIATDRFLGAVRSNRPIVNPMEVSRNPLIQLIHSISADGADSLIRGIVIEAILEEVKEYFLSSYAEFVWEKLLAEQGVEFLIEILQQNIHDEEQPLVLASSSYLTSRRASVTVREPPKVMERELLQGLVDGLQSHHRQLIAPPPSSAQPQEEASTSVVEEVGKEDPSPRTAAYRQVANSVLQMGIQQYLSALAKR